MRCGQRLRGDLTGGVGRRLGVVLVLHTRKSVGVEEGERGGDERGGRRKREAGGGWRSPPPRVFSWCCLFAFGSARATFTRTLLKKTSNLLLSGRKTGPCSSLFDSGPALILICGGTHCQIEKNGILLFFRITADSVSLKKGFVIIVVGIVSLEYASNCFLSPFFRYLSSPLEYRNNSIPLLYCDFWHS
jgi:hypothetical protein